MFYTSLEVPWRQDHVWLLHLYAWLIMYLMREGKYPFPSSMLHWKVFLGVLLVSQTYQVHRQIYLWFFLFLKTSLDFFSFLLVFWDFKAFFDFFPFLIPTSSCQILLILTFRYLLGWLPFPCPLFSCSFRSSFSPADSPVISLNPCLFYTLPLIILFKVELLLMIQIHPGF